jgi:hypothetical protein
MYLLCSMSESRGFTIVPYALETEGVAAFELATKSRFAIAVFLYNPDGTTLRYSFLRA